jgi:hypothetical protein
MDVALRPGTPLRGAYARLAAAYPALRITVPGGPAAQGPGWVTGAALAAGDPAAERFLAAEEAALRVEYGVTPRPHVTASLALHRYAWPVCLLFTAPWFLERRVPRVAAGGAALHRGRGVLSVRPDGFACLPDDPAAALPEARPVQDEEALRAELRAALADHFGPVLAGFGPRLRRGPGVLWRTLTDEIAEGLGYAARLLGAEARAVTELDALLSGGGAPWTAPPGPLRRETRETGAAGGARGGRPGALPARPCVGPGRVRSTCCLVYTLRTAATCDSCPRAASRRTAGPSGAAAERPSTAVR